MVAKASRHVTRQTIMADEKEKLNPSSSTDEEAVTAQPRVQPQLTAAVDSNEVVSPHSYVILSSIVAVLCGICSACTLACSIPAVVMSFNVKSRSYCVGV